MISCPVRLCVALVLSAAAGVFAQTPPPAAAPAPAGGTPAQAKTGPGSPLFAPGIVDDRISLKMPDVDINTVLDALKQYTGRIILRPTQLQTATSYNIDLPPDIFRSEAILAIETVLALNGIGLAPQGDRYLKVVNLQQVGKEAPELISGSTLALPPTGRTAAKLFQLEFARVQEIAPLLGNVLNGLYGGPVMLQNANAMLIVDSISNLQRIELLLQQVDKPVTAGMKPRFFPVRNVKASELVNKIRGILNGPLQQQLGSATTYFADDRTQQIAVMTDPRQWDFFTELIDRLDQKSDPNTRNEVIYLKHAEATKVANTLSLLVNGQNSATQRTNSGSVRPGQVSATPTATPAPPSPAPVGAAAMPGLDSMLGSNEFSNLVTILPDERSNAVIVSGTIDDIRLLTALIDKLDIILAQVRIEVVIAEVTLSDNHTSGISQLGMVITGDKLTGFTGTIPGVSITEGTVTRSSGATILSGGRDLAATIAISTTPRKSDTSILSQPSIATTHNKEAKFFFGETRPIVTGVTSTPTAGGTGAGFSTSSQVQQQEIGTTITVKPLIGKDGSVQLDIKMEISEVGDRVRIDNNDQYVIAKRTANSFTIAQSGEIVVLGGMQRKRDGRSTNRLGPIPILGDIFGSRTKEDQRTDLIFFIRPMVLTNTPADNIEVMKRVEGFEKAQRDSLKQRLDPNFTPSK